MEALCPVCTGQLQQPRRVSVCSRCYDGLREVSNLPVETTTEFPAITAEQLERPPAAAPAALPAAVLPQIRCSWCDRTSAEVKKLLSKGSAHICNECVALCTDILQAELAGDWR